ncbi:MAG: GerMN domain-containing protein [Turicibacter sp.]
MEKSLLKRLTLPVLAMLLVYYVTTDEANPASNNLIKSVNEQNSMEQSEVVNGAGVTVFALHESGHIVQTSVPNDKSSDQVEMVFELFTTKMNQLPIGIKSPLSPSATLINYVMEDGVLTLNVTSDFLSYDVENERTVLEALVWSFTEIQGVETVKFQIEGVPVSNLNGLMSVQRGLTREMGINLELDTVDVNDSQLVTVYYLTDDTQNGYLVPVTRLISSSQDPISYAINELINGPKTSEYVSVFDNQVALIDPPELEDGVISLNFNDALYYDRGQSMVSSLMMKQLVSTLTEFQEVDHVLISVDGNERVVNEQMKSVMKPITEITK